VTSQHVGGRPLLQRVLISLAVLLAGILALQASSALAVVKTQTYIGDQPGTPDIERVLYSEGIQAFTPGGSSLGLIAGTINLALDGTPVTGFCIDVHSLLNTSPVSADVQEIPATTADLRAQLYILLNQAPTGTPTPAKANEAAVAQVAIWVLQGDLRENGPTSDATLNAQVAALLATARAQSATPASLALSAGAVQPGQTASTITVTGRPGAVVKLAVTAGAGSLSASQVTIGAGGSATATLTAAGPGSVTLSATTAGDGRLFRVIPADQSQATTHGLPSTLSASATVAFQAAPTTTPVTPVVSGSPSPAKIRLRLTKTAPAASRPLALVPYRITVTNPTKREATGVVLRDRVPNGLSFVRASRRATIRNGAVVIPIGRLAPHTTRVVTVWMRADAQVRGRRVNVVTVSGTNVRTLSAHARTKFRALARRVSPAVTG